jgi:hypothetical protein
MANLDSAFGFRPVGHLQGRPIVTASVNYTAKDNTLIVAGMLLKLTDAGSATVVEPAAASDDGDIVGVAANTVLAAATVRGVIVYTDPFIIYEIQSDNKSTNSLALADCVGKTADIANNGSATYTGPYETTIYYATAELDDSDIGTGANLKIVGKSPDSEWGEFAKLWVVINEGAFVTGVAGIAAA